MVWVATRATRVMDRAPTRAMATRGSRAMVSVCPQSDVLTLVCLIAAATCVKPKLYAHMAASVSACYDVQIAGSSVTHEYHAARGCIEIIRCDHASVLNSMESF